MQKNLTGGSVTGALLRFSVPYLIACFLQSFYGMADLFIIGRFCDAAAISAVSVGSQLMHMLTVMIVGLAMGTTVMIGRAVGAKDEAGVRRAIGNSAVLFLGLSLVGALILMAAAGSILKLLATPSEAFRGAKDYLLICFAGVPLITAYNVISSIFRGLGDSKRPMLFILIAGILNMGLDVLFIGPMGLGAAGAAIATVLSQAVSVAIGLTFLLHGQTGLRLTLSDLSFSRSDMGDILRIGVPISCQDGLIQISFLIITMIANSRGVIVAASVGIVEKIISFLFLVPSAMLSSVSAIAAQNAGAGLHQRGRQTLYYALGICLAFGGTIALILQFCSQSVLTLFAGSEPEVVRMGSQYLRAYVWDCVSAGIHFCFSGFFCAYGKSVFSFLHNIAAIVLVRIPGAYLASVLYPQTLYPMGLAAPLGSALSAVICVALYIAFFRCWQDTLPAGTGSD